MRRTRANERRSRARRRLLVPLWVALAAAGCVDHYLIHPRTAPHGVLEWSEELERDGLEVRLEWAEPPGTGPLPAVIVHPEAGHGADEMRGVLRSLAGAGYLAVAADYRRRTPGGRVDALFPWRCPDDPRAVLDRLLEHPRADPARVGALGFSQGGVYSLLIAAYTGEIAAVVAYYPVTDFAAWLETPRKSWGRRLVFRRVIEPHFRRRSGAADEAAFRAFLARASPLAQAGSIRAPVLLVHGDRDRSASVAESRRLAARLEELGREVRLVVVEDAAHVFNFRNPTAAQRAWRETRAWLDWHLTGR